VDFNASAYGTHAYVGKTVVLGKTSYVTLGCTTEVGISKANTTTSVSAPPLVGTGTINTTASTVMTASNSTSTVQGANLLAGLITADEVVADSTTSDNNGLQTSAAGSSFTNLVVAGTQIQGTPPPNTVINLAGFGTVTLNEQTSVIGPKSASLTVNMIHVSITLANTLGIPVGTQIIVADAESKINLTLSPALLDGMAYGSKITVKPMVVVSGPSALVVMPCLGTDGKIRTNDVTGVNVVNELTTGTVTDTAQGSTSKVLDSAQTTSTVQNANVLSSLISADVITAVATGTTPDGQNLTFSHKGSSFVNLVVVGHPELKDHVPPNTQVHLAGVGTLWLYRVLRSSDNIEVRMVEVIVGANNTLGLPAGTDIRVAVAEASLHSTTVP
jgi:hypothetical protein